MILDRLAAALGYERPKPLDANVWTAGTAVSSSGEVVTSATGLELDVVQGVLEALAGPISTLPLGVIERIDADRRRPATDHPLHRILHDRPNDRQTAQEFRDEQQRHLAWHRNAYARIVSEDGAPVAGLVPYHPDRLIRIERLSDGTIWYEFRGLGTGATEKIRGDLVWHVRKAPLTEDALRGRPVYETARETLGRALAVERYGARWFRNAGHHGGILKHPGDFKSLEDREKFLDNWRAGGSGENQHRDRLVTHGLDYVRHTVQNDQAQFIETLRAIENKVCRIWNMPPHRVQILDRATNNNIEHQGLEFVVHTMAPWIAAWEQAARRDLLVGDDAARYSVEFNVSGLLRGDIKSRYEAYALGRQWGWLSVNDILRRENSEPIGPAGDAYLQPLNMVPAGSQATGAQP